MGKIFCFQLKLISDVSVLGSEKKYILFWFSFEFIASIMKQSKPDEYLKITI